MLMSAKLIETALEYIPQLRNKLWAIRGLTNRQIVQCTLPFHANSLQDNRLLKSFSLIKFFGETQPSWSVHSLDIDLLRSLSKYLPV